MSASLVGSEMCIRDRLAEADDMHTAWKAALGSLYCVYVLDAPEHPMPVSYTHLTLPTICSV
eukprot:4685016-Alexandrium_andersonii.AAC.1